MVRVYLLLIISLLYGRTACSQKADTICGTQFMGFQQLQSQAIANTVTAPASATYTIPVVCVVYHTGETVGTGANLSDAVIQAAIDDMNQQYAGTSILGTSPDTQIRFVLAKRTPDCAPSNGIYRINASDFPNYASQGVTSYQHGRSLARAYPPFDHVNITEFITIRFVRNIAFAAGYAEGSDIFVRTSGYTGQPGHTLLAHEMGHALSLSHTFSETFNCPANTNPDVDGDGVSDTDPHRYNNYGNCNPATINNCTGNQFGELVYNFMNYSCQRKFTQGQVNKIRNYIASTLTELTNSLYSVSPTTADVVIPSSCSITFGQPPTDYITGIGRFQFNTIDHTSRTPTGNMAGNYNDFSCIRKTTVLPNTSYPFSLSSYSGQRKIYIDYNNDGSFNESNELVFSTSSGISSGTILIPATAVTNMYLRMRVVVDRGPTPPTACHLPGHSEYGCGEIQDYSLLVSAPCPQMYSIKSGQWNDPTVWSCNRVPNQSDVATISVGHAIAISSTTATVQRIIYQTDARITFEINGKLAILNPY